MKLAWSFVSSSISAIAPSRWPADDDHAELLGIRLPRLALDSTNGPLDGAYAALRRLAKFP